jgi:ethanolamine ammonia-lyase small subunit
VVPAAWDGLRRFTDARIALGRAGHSQPTAAHLAFQLAHAQARDHAHRQVGKVRLVAEGLGVLLKLAVPEFAREVGAHERIRQWLYHDLGQVL